MKSNEKLKTICKEKNVKLIDICRATGISKGTIYEWSKGLYTPKIDKITKVALFLNVDVNDLIDDDKIAEARIPTATIAEDCVELVDVYSKLTDTDKKILIDMARNMLERELLLKKVMGVNETPTS